MRLPLWVESEDAQQCRQCVYVQPDSTALEVQRAAAGRQRVIALARAAEPHKPDTLGSPGHKGGCRKGACVALQFFLRLNYLDMHRTYGCAANPQRTRPLCDFCGRKFCQPQKLKVHIKRMHSGECQGRARVLVTYFGERGGKGRRNRGDRRGQRGKKGRLVGTGWGREGLLLFFPLLLLPPWTLGRDASRR